MAKVADIFANRSFASVTMSAANTITFQQINFAVGVFQGIALNLHRVDYYPSSDGLQEIVATADRMYFGLTLRDDLTTLDATNQSVVSSLTLNLNEARTAESNMVYKPISHDFTALPQGGLLIPANPIYLAMLTAGFAAASSVAAVLYYTFRKLTDRESIELLQSIIPGNV